MADSPNPTDGKKRKRPVWRVARLVIVAALVVGLIPGIRPDPTDDSLAALGYARDYVFNFAGWEAHALGDKALDAAAGPRRYMTDAEQTQYVRDYFDLVGQIQALENDVEAIYADPAIGDPEAASADLRAERDALRADQQTRQALAESIIQAQVGQTLAEYGFGVGGQALPPVAIRFTELPSILVISPRDHIERIGSYALEHGLTVDQQETLEDNVDAELDVSSLVVPIGGLAIWPSMLIESSNLASVYQVAAHEWTHHYLAFYPLGFHYGATPDLYTMNETVANIVGDEIGWAVLDRYYPDLAPAPPDYTPTPPEGEAPAEPAEPAAFDFRAEMRQTRIRADELLAAGQIDEAEAYMEARRAVFVEHGYLIRKLNQAYFAFHGSYADQPGASGADPIGPALRELRYYSPSLHDFIATVRGMTSYDEVAGALDEAQAAAVGG
jgi:hypothetical protein